MCVNNLIRPFLALLVVPIRPCRRRRRRRQSPRAVLRHFFGWLRQKGKRWRVLSMCVFLNLGPRETRPSSSLHRRGVRLGTSFNTDHTRASKQAREASNKASSKQASKQQRADRPPTRRLHLSRLSLSLLDPFALPNRRRHRCRHSSHAKESPRIFFSPQSL